MNCKTRRFSRAFASTEYLSHELEERNAALSRMDALKDEFLAKTSHEFRTPLHGIAGIAESLTAGVTAAITCLYDLYREMSTWSEQR